jgi:thiol-disulfide isomerase/thioredoxin
MKTFILFILIALFVQCKQPDYIIVKGKIENHEKGNYSQGYDLIKDVRFDAEGNFCDTLRLISPFFRFRSGYFRCEVYAKDGDVVEIYGDCKMPGKKSYKGSNVDFISYLNGDEYPKELLDLNKAKSDDFKAYERVFVNQKEKSLARLNAIKNKISSELFESEKNYIEQLAGANLLSLRKGIDEYAKKIRQEYKENFDFEDTYLYQRTNWEYQVIDVLGQNKDNVYNGIFNDIKNQYALDKMLTLYAQWYYIKEDLESLKKHHNRIINTVSDNKAKEKIVEYYETALRVAPGIQVPNYKFKNSNNEEVSLHDYKGKYIYIDLWASWCGPCKAQIPYVQEREKECKEANKNIVFVSISCDKSEKAWRKSMEKHHCHGEQLITSFGTEFMKFLQVEGIPRFVFLDTNCKIINANAPRPQENEEFYEMLDEVGVR